MANTAAILTGSGLGMLLRTGLPERLQNTLIQSVGLVVILIGLQMALKTQNIVVMIISMSVGAICGELLQLDTWLEKLGQLLSNRISGKYGKAGEGFIAAALMFCIGAMAVVGPIQEGLTGVSSTLYAKAILDGIVSLILAASYGIGVSLAAFAVLIYQGSITLLANLLSNFFSDAAIREPTACGGLLIIAIGLSMLEIPKIKVANLLPAIPITVILTSILGKV